MKPKPVWCRHIKWMKYSYWSGWQFLIIRYGTALFNIPHSWKCCPICCELRPGYHRNIAGDIVRWRIKLKAPRARSERPKRK